MDEADTFCHGANMSNILDFVLAVELASATPQGHARRTPPSHHPPY
jgi:hypothetical protein